jgi:predicted  nucleic acid-binding Zn ribbon protein
MFAVELRLVPSGRGDSCARVDAITSLAATLVRNGNLMRDYVVTADRTGWTVTGVAPARDAFRTANLNDFVRQRFAGLAAVNLSQPAIRFSGTVPETASDCRCATPRRFLLFTTFLHTEPALRCLRCNGTVPLYRLPRSASGEHSDLLSWESNYKACDTLQMNCKVGERFGERQLSDLDSSLTQSGLAVCREIERLTGRPAYYYLYRGDTRRPSVEPSRNCPGCNCAWRLKRPLHGKFDFKCDRCRLVSNIAWNVR